MRHAILLVYDEPEKKLVQVKRDPWNLLDAMINLIELESGCRVLEEDCFCLKNNSIDRAKILIRYLRKQLKFGKEQITFLRTGQFGNAVEIRYALENIFEQHRNEDILFYYTGHGLLGDKFGWSLGEGKQLYYRSLRTIFRNFLGRLVFINDCCHALSIDRQLKILGSRYLLLGACRSGCTSADSILDPILGYWFHGMKANPKVACTGKWKDTILDLPAYASRGSYYNCGCGSDFSIIKRFTFIDAPSLRRGAELDHLFFPV